MVNFYECIIISQSIFNKLDNIIKIVLIYYVNYLILLEERYVKYLCSFLALHLTSVPQMTMKITLYGTSYIWLSI